MKPKTELDKNPDADDSSDVSEESFEESLSQIIAFINKNPKEARETFLELAQDDPKTLLRSIFIFENEPRVEEAICDAAGIEPELAIEISFNVVNKNLRGKIVAKAREALKDSFRMV